MDAALTCQSAIQQQILIGESQTPAKSCRTRPSKVETRINFNAANTETGTSRLTRSGPLRRELFYSSCHRAAPERRLARPRRATSNPTTDRRRTDLLGHARVRTGHALLAPALAAKNAEVRGRVELRLCLVRCSRDLWQRCCAKELAAACANWRREWSTEAARVLSLLLVESCHTQAGEQPQQRGRSDAWLRCTGRYLQTICCTVRQLAGLQ